MIHRHLVPHDEWSYAKIDDTLDRGEMPEWHALLHAVEHSYDLAKRVLSLATATHRYGTSNLWIKTIHDIYPMIDLQ